MAKALEDPLAPAEREGETANGGRPGAMGLVFLERCAERPPPLFHLPQQRVIDLAAGAEV